MKRIPLDVRCGRYAEMWTLTERIDNVGGMLQKRLRTYLKEWDVNKAYLSRINSILDISRSISWYPTAFCNRKDNYTYAATFDRTTKPYDCNCYPM